MSKVTRLELHEGFFIPGLIKDVGGQFGKSIPPAGKTLEGLDMELQENGSVSVQFGPKGRRTKIIIGAANIKYTQHAPDDK